MKIKDLFRNEKELKLACESMKSQCYAIYTDDDIRHNARLNYISTLLETLNSLYNESDYPQIKKLSVRMFFNMNDLREILASMALCFIDCIAFNKDFPTEINEFQFIDYMGFFKERLEDYE